MYLSNFTSLAEFGKLEKKLPAQHDFRKEKTELKMSEETIPIDLYPFLPVLPYLISSQICDSNPYTA